MEEAFLRRGVGRAEIQDLSLLLYLSFIGGGFHSGGNRGRGRGGKRGNQSGKNVMVEPHRHEGE